MSYFSSFEYICTGVTYITSIKTTFNNIYVCGLIKKKKCYNTKIMIREHDVLDIAKTNKLNGFPLASCTEHMYLSHANKVITMPSL